MKITQLSVFLENRPGRLSVPCRELARAGINIITLSLADTQQFGILRLIVRDWEKAKDVLEKCGHVVRVNEVVAVEVPDRPGGMAGVLEVVERKGINIEYMYAFTCRCGDKALVVFRFDDADNAVSALLEGGLKVVGLIDGYELREK
jgi:hypothetical protein